MSQKIINVGVVANDGTGDTLRTGAGKINDNFTELYSLTNTYVTNSNLATSLFPYATTTSLNSLIPNQASNSGKFLTTNGAVLSWTTVTGSGTVTSASVVSANGFAGTVATGSTTPAITISTSIFGILKGNGTAISSATSGTDYAPGTSALATGIIKSTTTTGALSIAVAGTDYQAPIGTISGVVKGNGANALIAAVSGTDYQAPLPTQSGQTGKYLTTDGTTLSWGTVSSSLAGLTGVTITSPTAGQVLKYNGSLWINDADATTGGAGAGTVTSASVVSANGFSGTVATASSTPAITITTSITGVLKGNGTAISAAVAGTDYQTPITLTTTGSSGAATFISNTLNIPQYAGDAVGPATATDNAITRFNTTTGKLFQNSLVTISDLGAIVAPIASSIIPFHYDNQAGFPSATTYHGAIAHSHADGKMYFAHSGAWLALANASELPAAYSATSIDALSDVDTTTSAPANGQTLVWNSVGSKWLPGTVAGSGGTVTSTSVVSANGFAGTVATSTSTPAITITTSITGVLKGNGTAISAAVSGTDYQAPIGTISGLVKGNGANALTAATAGTDYQTPVSATGLLKSSGVSGNVSAASAGTDYQAPITLTTTGSSGAATFTSNTLNIPQYASSGISWSISAADSNNYTFSGPGIVSDNTNDPVLYLYRGFTYTFVNTTGATHPFAIRVSNGGSAYTSGVSGSQTGTQTFIVPMNAPSTLYYQCTLHGGMGNTINIV